MAEDFKKKEVLEEIKIEELEEVTGGVFFGQSFQVATSESVVHCSAETSK